MTIPAPMPVPTVISIASSCPRAAPSLTSAHAAALASFSTTTGSPTLDSTFSRSGSSRQARFGAKRMLDRSASTKPAPDADCVSRMPAEQLGDGFADRLGRPGRASGGGRPEQLLDDLAMLVDCPGGYLGPADVKHDGQA